MFSEKETKYWDTLTKDEQLVLKEEIRTGL
jgi:hypothetical protein